MLIGIKTGSPMSQVQCSSNNNVPLSSRLNCHFPIGHRESERGPNSPDSSPPLLSSQPDDTHITTPIDVCRRPLLADFRNDISFGCHHTISRSSSTSYRPNPNTIHHIELSRMDHLLSVVPGLHSFDTDTGESHQYPTTVATPTVVGEMPVRGWRDRFNHIDVRICGGSGPAMMLQ